jgi:glucose/arabinose dehydrogenase
MVGTFLARRNRLPLAASLLACSALVGCWYMRPSAGGGQVAGGAEARRLDPADVALPAGYRVELVTGGLTFPTGVTFDDAGGVYVVEAGYAYGEVWTTPRLLRCDPGGRLSEVARGGDNGPWTGVTFHAGAFILGEGGERRGGRILRIGRDGAVTVLAEGLPSVGDHHTNRPTVGPDGYVYFGQGTATNSGVVGTDNFEFGWPKRHPRFHDVPARDITLAGLNFSSEDPRATATTARTATGAYVPFGTETRPGQVIPGKVPFTGGIMRLPASGGPLEMVAWGMRNPYALAFAPDGALYATENAYDERGSRPVFGTGDCLWKVEQGMWYGWPDFAMGLPVTDPRFNQQLGSPRLGFVLASHPNVPPEPSAIFGVHASANGLDFSRNATFGHVGEAFVAEFGDMAPNVGKVAWPTGFSVVRVNPKTGVISDFAANRGLHRGPASWLGAAGLERPMDVRFDPAGTALYVVDFGILEMRDRRPTPRARTGALWRITRS